MKLRNLTAWYFHLFAVFSASRRWSPCRACRLRSYSRERSPSVVFAARRSRRHSRCRSRRFPLQARSTSGVRSLRRLPITTRKGKGKSKMKNGDDLSLWFYLTRDLWTGLPRTVPPSWDSGSKLGTEEVGTAREEGGVSVNMCESRRTLVNL